MAILSGRPVFGPACAIALAVLPIIAPWLGAQPAVTPVAPHPGSALLEYAATERLAPVAGDIPASAPAMTPAPVPSDVLTPNTRQNTPYLKIAARAGLNWAAYSNDRYLDNTQLDVGQTSGEQDVYSHASGFGYGGGGEFEYPLNTGFSVVGTIEFVRVQFGREGPVAQESIASDGSDAVARARHVWSAKLSYLKFGAAAKLAFSSFYLLAGVTADRMLASQIVRTRSFDDPGYTFPQSGGRSTLTEDGPLVDPSGLHFAIRTGFGLVYQIADGIQFSPELTLDFGSSAINKSTESDLDIYALSAVLRYELR